MVRVRLPGGLVTAASLVELSTAANTFANGEVQLTSRGNLQLRGVPINRNGDVPAELVQVVRAAGLLPSESAELVRNILCSPMTGRVGGLADLRPLVRRLDELLCTVPALRALSGRFLFGLDDGTGDICSSGCDVGIVATAGGAALLTAAGESGPVIELRAAADWLVRLALTFLRLGGGAGDRWHVSELPGGGAALLAAVLDDPAQPDGLLDDQPGSQHPDHRTTTARYGTYQQTGDGSLVSLVVPLGRLTSVQVHAVAAAADLGSGQLVITPWHGVLVPDLRMAADSAELAQLAAWLAAAGLPAADSGWAGVSACTGAPGCARAAGPTSSVAARFAHRAVPGAEPVHVVACERRCGAPSGAHLEVMIEAAGEQSRHRPALAARGDTGRRMRRLATLTTATAAEIA